jgi:hypothetical protein
MAFPRFWLAVAFFLTHTAAMILRGFEQVKKMEFKLEPAALP